MEVTRVPRAESQLSIKMLLKTVVFENAALRCENLFCLTAVGYDGKREKSKHSYGVWFQRVRLH